MTVTDLKDNKTLALHDHGDNATHGDGLRYACLACGREYRSLLLVPAEHTGKVPRCAGCKAALDITNVMPKI